MAERPDPVAELDWDPSRARELGEGVVDLWAELLARLPELDVGGDFTARAVRSHLDLDIPEEGASNDELIARLRRLVFDGSIYPGHPGFLAYISGSGTVPGAAADLIASALNQNLGGFRLSPGANQIEAAVIRWRSTPRAKRTSHSAAPATCSAWASTRSAPWPWTRACACGSTRWRGRSSATSRRGSARRR